MGKKIVVVGAQWGDEGKGKIVDWLLMFYLFGIVARFSGGGNAGHTVHTPDGRKVVSHLIPCGVAMDKICVIGRGVFFDLEAYLKEYAATFKVLGSMPVIYIDASASLCTVYHRLYERWCEMCKGGNPIGTTGMAIGPHAGFDRLRFGPKVGDLFDEDRLLSRLEELHRLVLPNLLNLKVAVDAQREFFEDPHLQIPTPNEVFQDLITKRAAFSKEHVIDTRIFLQKAVDRGEDILFEGAQAVGLDCSWGTWPFVSSGNSLSSGASTGLGLSPSLFDEVLMVAKVLPTRVGAGPFPTEIWTRDGAMSMAQVNPHLFVGGPARHSHLISLRREINLGTATPEEISCYFQVLGDERGATTGRGRSVGYLDLPWLKYAKEVSGATGLALTRFDMLSGIKSIPVAVRYEGVEHISSFDLEGIKPVYEDWPCWSEDIGGMTTEDQLPQAAIEFLNGIERLVGVPINLVGTGPGRDHLILRSR